VLPFSKEAPKHKGIYARALEKEIKEQRANDIKKGNELMKEALNDPIFQIQLQKYNKDKLLI
jgi:hypothetical protein